MTDQKVISHPRRVKVFGLIAVVVAGFALCTAMKTLVCEKFGDSCPCQGTSDQTDCGCSTSEDE